MDEFQTQKLMTFVFADFEDVRVSADKRRVWFEMLKDVDFEDAMVGARILVARNLKFPPKVGDMLRAIAEATTPSEERETWGEAWDKWVRTASRYGHYRVDEAVEHFKLISPRGAQALGTTAREYMVSNTTDLPTFRAQFRQKYEALQARSAHQRVLPAEVQKALGYQVKSQKPNQLESVGSMLRVANSRSSGDF